MLTPPLRHAEPYRRKAEASLHCRLRPTNGIIAGGVKIVAARLGDAVLVALAQVDARRAQSVMDKQGGVVEVHDPTAAATPLVSDDLGVVSVDYLGHAAVHIFTLDSRPASLGAWVEDTIESLREYNKAFFEITHRRVEELDDGTGLAAIIYWGRTSSEYCTTYRSHLFVATKTSSAIVESRICEDFIREYEHEVARILKSVAPK